jgi:hypothetical protein
MERAKSCEKCGEADAAAIRLRNDRAGTLAVNRWGAGTEVSWHKEPASLASSEDVTSSAFFGFMKSSRGKSASEMQSELERERKQGLHDFTGILSRVEPARAVSLVVPLESDTDLIMIAPSR